MYGGKIFISLIDGSGVILPEERVALAMCDKAAFIKERNKTYSFYVPNLWQDGTEDALEITYKRIKCPYHLDEKKEQVKEEDE